MEAWEAAARAADDAATPLKVPRAVHQGRGASARVLYCDPVARSLGVRPGLTLAAARARASALSSIHVEPRLLDEARQRVVGELLRVSPRIAMAGVDRFWASPHPRALERWCAETRAVLAGHPPVVIGVGATATLAHAAACSIAEGHRIVSPEEAEAFLDDAPVEVLELGSEALDILAALGVRRVAQLRALDPISLGMRFGPAVADAWRRAEGLDPRRPATPRAPEDDAVEVELDTALERVDPLFFLLGPASEQLLARLRGRELGPVRVGLVLGLEGRIGAPTQKVDLEVRASAPLDDARALLELLRTRLERLTLAAPIVKLRLEARSSVALGERTRPLLPEGPGRDPAARDVALQRLRSRLGEEAVRRASRVEQGAPLDRAAWMEGLEPSPGEALPWRRLDPPAPVRHGRVQVGGRVRQLLRLSRVERITPPWWTDGTPRVVLSAWAEVEGPMLVLLYGRCSSECDDEWEAVAWVD